MKLYFDYPLSERVRNFIRLGQLAQRFHETLESDDKWLHHIAVCTLFELSECASRADLKRDLLHDLERQRIQQNASAEPDQAHLDKLNRAIAELQAANRQSAQSLRENEWLTAFKHKLNIPGSTTAVELPSYHYWLHQDAEAHRRYLEKWSSATLPVQQAVELVLAHLYRHTHTLECEAKNGVYQHGGLVQSTHLLRIGVAREHEVVPEVSANKYFTNIGFLQANQESTRSKRSEKDFSFELILCGMEAAQA
ncbi:cell division protein ZapD [Conchiformibius kuhniae]|uniref:Cell division protein ZapD n=1 Tax=Conchiformibius kuhniae TaxID=211502 RepID=A0ABD8B870_9NEIS|nr:cell division protein ZapD [Conchiformibius kuhniae]